MIHRPNVVPGYLPALVLALLTPAVPSAHATEAFTESGGEVVIETENHDAKIPRSSHDWTTSTATSGYSGTSAMRATPETALEITTGYSTTSPELVYNIRISTPGTYYVWMRGFKPDGGADSVHVGIDGTAPSSGSNMDQFVYNQWAWIHDTRTVQIPTAGLHTFHIWMREDGFYADKLVLRQGGAGTAPTGTGPAESQRVTVGGGDTTPPTVSLTAPTSGAAVRQTITVSATASDNVGVVGVQFKLDGANLGAEDTTSPYSVSWNTTTATQTSHTLTAVARDAATNSTTSTGVTVTVDNTNPQITITSPLNGSVVTP